MIRASPLCLRKKKGDKRNMKQRISLDLNATGIEDRRKIFLLFKNVTVLGDGNACHLASLMLIKMHISTHISGECKPGAGFMSIAPATAILYFAGTNDVAAGRQIIFFRQLKNVIINCCKTSRKPLVPLPPRISPRMFCLLCYLPRQPLHTWKNYVSHQRSLTSAESGLIISLTMVSISNFRRKTADRS